MRHALCFFVIVVSVVAIGFILLANLMGYPIQISVLF